MVATKVSPAKSIDFTFSALERELVGLAEAMPADKYDFAPDPDLFKSGQHPNFKGVRTFSQTIAHIAQANEFIYLGVGGKKQDAAFAAKMAAIGKLTKKDDLVKALKDSLAAGHAAIATLTPDNAWEQSGRGATNTRAEQAMYGVAHSRDHYGQLVEYLRMNGMIPPASEGRPLANPPKAN